MVIINKRTTTPPATLLAMAMTVVLFEDDVLVAKGAEDEKGVDADAPAETEDRGSDRLDVVGLAEAKA